MSEKFKLEVISPEKIIFKKEVEEVILPSFEGQMTILRDHISLVTFLRPGLVKINSDEKKQFFVEEGTVEFSNNTLVILTSTAVNVDKLDNNKINEMISKVKIELDSKNLDDKKKFMLSHKIDVLKEINQ